MDDETTIHGPEQHHKLIVDTTFIAIYQAEDSEQRKAYYHAKSPKNYVFKVRIACEFHHRIAHVSRCYPGNAHDITILRESGLLEHSQEDKKPRGGELTAEDKDFNQSICSARAAIENINQRLKNYAILGNVYRGPYDDIRKITIIAHVVSALCNLQLHKHAIRNHRS
ncbi:unnamed protein product [Rotaria sordida]|uniref:DDE Tnp4 domain-containing protein n=1 Tax=Rotaria sordida TaxID=392033 RepID=A0A819YJ21_9BILA|nr:unnamed protein product [Rotaria sordida]CAF4157629.1 unnamed protein product [Rotaria sordida]